MTKKKLCVITGSRAEYGLLRRLCKLIQKDKFFDLQIIVAGTHLSKEQLKHGIRTLIKLRISRIHLRANARLKKSRHY